MKKVEYAIKIDAMEIGETLKFPKDMRNKVSSLAARLYCHGKGFLVRSKKEDDYLTITRYE